MWFQIIYVLFEDIRLLVINGNLICFNWCFIHTTFYQSNVPGRQKTNCLVALNVGESESGISEFDGFVALLSLTRAI